MSRHPAWCARGHRCGLGEHRADPVVIDSPELGRVVLVRVADSRGRQHAEISIRLALADAEPAARKQLLALTADLRTLITRATRRDRAA
jgi:hypothetical protein